MQEKRWELNKAEETAVNLLQQRLGIHPMLCSLLVQRGINTYEEARSFFRPDLKALHDPFLMKDMDRAVSRLRTALAQGERIMVYGDYDVDGTTAVAVVYGFLKTLSDHIWYYQPDREREGYGVSAKGIEYAAGLGVTLVVALDCGIKAVDRVKEARSLGIDFIICDHHLPGEVIPNAVAVLDPKQDDCGYPYKELCGCGIGFKLIQAYALQHQVPEERVWSKLGLVAVSIAADIVPITGENRILAYFGLQLLNRQPSAGIAAMLDSARFKGLLSVRDLVFKIAPRINAAGRMAHANLALALLLEEDSSAADELAAELELANLDRKELDSRITGEALDMIRGDEVRIAASSNVLYHPNWHKGVIGIVASRVIEHFYRPTVICTRSNGKVVGSARSVHGFDLYEALKDCSDHFLQFGGHRHAAGVTLTEEALPAFTSRFEEVVRRSIREESLLPVVRIDAEIELREATLNFYDIVRQMAPFGPGNRQPVFVSGGLTDTGRSRVVGNDHLRLEVKQHGQTVMGGIAFGAADQLDMVRSGRPFSLAYQLQLNEWRGQRTVEMMVRDLRPDS